MSRLCPDGAAVSEIIATIEGKIKENDLEFLKNLYDASVKGKRVWEYASRHIQIKALYKHEILYEILKHSMNNIDIFTHFYNLGAKTIEYTDINNLFELCYKKNAPIEIFKMIIPDTTCLYYPLDDEQEDNIEAIIDSGNFEYIDALFNHLNEVEFRQGNIKYRDRDDVYIKCYVDDSDTIILAYIDVILKCELYIVEHIKSKYIDFYANLNKGTRAAISNAVNGAIDKLPSDSLVKRYLSEHDPTINDFVRNYTNAVRHGCLETIIWLSRQPEFKLHQLQLSAEVKRINTDNIAIKQYWRESNQWGYSNSQ